MSRKMTRQLAATIVAPNCLLSCSAPAVDSPASLPADGPLRGPQGSGWIESFSKGTTFTNGYVYLRNTDDGPIVIEGVEPNLVGNSVEYLGSRQLDEYRRWGYFQHVEGWPESLGKTDSIHAVGEIVVRGRDGVREMPPRERPLAGANLLLGFRAVREGRTDMEGITVTYSQGDETWEEYFSWGMTVCVEMSMTCAAPNS